MTWRKRGVVVFVLAYLTLLVGQAGYSLWTASHPSPWGKQGLSREFSQWTAALQGFPLWLFAPEPLPLSVHLSVCLSEDPYYERGESFDWMHCNVTLYSSFAGRLSSQAWASATPTRSFRFAEQMLLLFQHPGLLAQFARHWDKQLLPSLRKQGQFLYIVEHRWWVGRSTQRWQHIVRWEQSVKTPNQADPVALSRVETSKDGT